MDYIQLKIGTCSLSLSLKRSLRISTPQSDSACSSSAESSDCESSTHSHSITSNGAPVEILPGLFLGNASHSEDSRALQKYNIQVCSMHILLNFSIKNFFHIFQNKTLENYTIQKVFWENIKKNKINLKLYRKTLKVE